MISESLLITPTCSSIRERERERERERSMSKKDADVLRDVTRCVD